MEKDAEGDGMTAPMYISHGPLLPLTATLDWHGSRAAKLAQDKIKDKVYRSKLVIITLSACLLKFHCVDLEKAAAKGT